MQAVRSGNVCEILVNDETKKKREFGSCLLDWFIIYWAFFFFFFFGKGGWTKEALAAGSDYWVNSDFDCLFYFFFKKISLFADFFGKGGARGETSRETALTLGGDNAVLSFVDFLFSTPLLCLCSFPLQTITNFFLISF